MKAEVMELLQTILDKYPYEYSTVFGIFKVTSKIFLDFHIFSFLEWSILSLQGVLSSRKSNFTYPQKSSSRICTKASLRRPTLKNRRWSWRVKVGWGPKKRVKLKDPPPKSPPKTKMTPEVSDWVLRESWILRKNFLGKCPKEVRPSPNISKMGRRKRPKSLKYPQWTKHPSSLIALL